HSDRGTGAQASGIYPLGTTMVTFTATDPSGNSTSCATSVTVRDTIPPRLSLHLSPTLLWPPNHRMVSVESTWQATDDCDSAPGVARGSLTSREADDSRGSGDGGTAGDVQQATPGTPDSLILLRAERSAVGPGRSYTATYVARDASANTTSALGVVSVP